MPKSRSCGGPAPVGIGVGRQSGAHIGSGGEPVGVVERCKLGQGQGVDGPLPVRRPVDGAVVAHHQMSVGGGVHVELDARGPELEGPTDGEERRRRRLPGPALVGVGDDAAPEPRIGGAGATAATVASRRMLDHILVDVISQTRRALEDALLQRQAVEERFQVDVFLGDVSWETSYSLPGEEKPPRVRADVSVDWPTWSQSAYRSWSIGEPPEDLPEVVVEITLRLQRLRPCPTSTIVLACLARGEPPHRHRHPGPGRPRGRAGARAGRARPPLRRGDLLPGHHPPGRGGPGGRLHAGRRRPASWPGGWPRCSSAWATSTSSICHPRRRRQRRGPLSRATAARSEEAGVAQPAVAGRPGAGPRSGRSPRRRRARPAGRSSRGRSRG